MFKATFKTTMTAGALALFTLFSSAYTVGAADLMMNTSTPVAQAYTIAAPQAISPEEAEALQFMREEEKLAHNVYVTLYEQWNLPVFSNIARSEQKHTDAVAYLLDLYDISDPAAGNELGEFTDPDLQALYDQLVAQGSASIADALKVGGAIEEIDILDLQERLAETDNADIERVYENLMTGSENHLRAFVSNLKAQTGETYAPQYLSQVAYDEIISAAGSQGGQGGNGAWGGGRGGRGGGRR